MFTLLCILASSNLAHLASGHLIVLTIAFVQEVSIHMCMCTCVRVRVCVYMCACMCVHACVCACMSLSQTSSVPFLIAPNYVLATLLIVAPNTTINSVANTYIKSKCVHVHTVQY